MADILSNLSTKLAAPVWAYKMKYFSACRVDNVTRFHAGKYHQTQPINVWPQKAVCLTDWCQYLGPSQGLRERVASPVRQEFNNVITMRTTHIVPPRCPKRQGPAAFELRSLHTVYSTLHISYQVAFSHVNHDPSACLNQYCMKWREFLGIYATVFNPKND